MRHYSRGTRLAALAGVFCSVPAYAQWVEQTFDLRVGWNSVYLEVDPSPEDADLLFQEQPFAAVWVRTPDLLVEGPPDCSDPNDPACAPSPDGGWSVWVPPAHPGRLATTLHLVTGGRVYLIEATRPTSWSVTGKPNPSRCTWRRGFNLAGFHVVDDASSTPTFAEYLAASPAHSSTVVYELQADGVLSQVVNPANTRITPGRGVWVKADRDAEYDGPIAIDRGSLRGIDFGRRLVDHRVGVENLATSARDVTISYTPSAPVPAGPPEPPANAGDVPLTWLDYGGGDEVHEAYQWLPLSSEGWQLDRAGDPGSLRTVRLGVRRGGLPPATVDGESPDSEYQGILEVTDGEGFRRRLSVAAQVEAGVGGRVAGGGGTMAQPGLYLGDVTVNQVAWVSAGARVWANEDAANPGFVGDRHCFGGAENGNDCAPDRKRCAGPPGVALNNLVCEETTDCPDGATCETITDCPGGTCDPFCIGGSNNGNPCGSASDCPDGRCSTESDNSALRPTPAEFVLPVLIHLSDTGEYKMLTEVTMMWEPQGEPAETQGRFVLVTPDCPSPVLDALEAGSIQDGQPFARRVSTAAFAFDHDLPLAGDFSTALTGATTLAQDHPLNPFHHKYHPDHDCDQAGECYDVTRSFTFTFSADPPPGLVQPGWGDTLLAGSYAERLEGLHKHHIDVGGRFELRRITSIPTLNAE